MPKSPTYTLEQLADWLRILPAQVEALVAQGLPNKSGSFDPISVANWMEDQGLAERCNFTGEVGTQADVAAAFGVSRSTVKTEWRPAGMPGRSGHYDLAEIAAWKAARQKDPGSSATAAAPEDQKKTMDLLLRRREAEARCKEAEAERKERENALAEESIVNVRDVERFLSEFFTKLRDQMDSLPDEMTPLLPLEVRKEFTDDLTDRLGQRLRQLHRWAQMHLTDLEQEAVE